MGSALPGPGTAWRGAPTRVFPQPHTISATTPPHSCIPYFLCVTSRSLPEIDPGILNTQDYETSPMLRAQLSMSSTKTRSPKENGYSKWGVLEESASVVPRLGRKPLGAELPQARGLRLDPGGWCRVSPQSVPQGPPVGREPFPGSQPGRGQLSGASARHPQELCKPTRGQPACNEFRGSGTTAAWLGLQTSSEPSTAQKFRLSAFRFPSQP